MFCDHLKCRALNETKTIDRQTCYKTLTHSPFTKENMYFDGPMGFRNYSAANSVIPSRNAKGNVDRPVKPNKPTPKPTQMKKEEPKKEDKKVDKAVKKSIKALVKKLKRSGFPLSKEQLTEVKRVCRSMTGR